MEAVRTASKFTFPFFPEIDADVGVDGLGEVVLGDLILSEASDCLVI